ncbi:polysaccharide lyase family 6 [Chitinispirillum alkaliphilum]|nr:polysaccharide lyase family 6 [Chitinispirillum alkaliphilum]
MGKQGCMVSLFLVFAVFMSWGNRYYVDGANGDDSSDGLSKSTAWETIRKANKTVTPGDTVFIRAGRYEESITPISCGTSQNRITFTNYNDERVVLANVYSAIHMRGRSYITISGIDIEDVDYFVRLDTCTHVWILNGNFTNAKNRSLWPTGVVVRHNSQYNRIKNCVIGKLGYSTEDNDWGGVMNIGSINDTTDKSHFNLIENNLLFHGGHHILTVSSSYNVIRNNHFHNDNWMSCSRTETDSLCGNRHIILEDNASNVRWNIIEGNRFAFSGVPPDQNTSSGVSIRTPNNIIRRNMFYNCDGPGLSLATFGNRNHDASFNYIYHNVFFKNGHSQLSGVESWKQAGLQLATHRGMDITDVSIKNNIFYGNKFGGIVFYYVDEERQTIANNWNEQGDPLFVNITDPYFPQTTDLPDFSLLEQSPCINSGTFLTRIVSPGGSGYKFEVEDAGYFSNGFGVIEGDIIQLEGDIERARIIAVDYETNRITVDKNLTWSNNTGVSLGYTGDAPDIGAFEHTPVVGIRNLTGGLDNSPSHLSFSSLNSGVRINYNGIDPRNAVLTIYDIRGRLVETISLGNGGPSGTVEWFNDSNWANRFYIARLKTGTHVETKQFLLLR